MIANCLERKGRGGGFSRQDLVDGLQGLSLNDDDDDDDEDASSSDYFDEGELGATTMGHGTCIADTYIWVCPGSREVVASAAGGKAVVFQGKPFKATLNEQCVRIVRVTWPAAGIMHLSALAPCTTLAKQERIRFQRDLPSVVLDKICAKSWGTVVTLADDNDAQIELATGTRHWVRWWHFPFLKLTQEDQDEQHQVALSMSYKKRQMEQRKARRAGRGRHVAKSTKPPKR